MTRSVRPLVVTSLVAVLSTGLLALAVARGWLGVDTGRGANFCEAAGGLVRQPANTFSNAGFVLVGLGIAWHAGRRARLGATLSARPALASAYAVTVVLLGPASAAMHATQSEAGGLLDLTSMYLVASFAAAYAAMRWWRLGTSVFVTAFVALVGTCEVVGASGGSVPVVHHPGNLAFGILLLAAVALEIAIRVRGELRTDLRYGAVALGSMAVAFVIWNLAQHGWCDPASPLQGHAVWHLLSAVAAYFLFRLYASEAAASSRNQMVSSEPETPVAGIW